MIRRGKVILGTRGSDLALAQAQVAKVILEGLPDPPVVEIRVIKTTGDRRLDLRLADSGQTFEKGLFTKELEEGLLGGEIDVAVHSLKDLPTELPAGLEVGAVLPRHDPVDLLVTKQELQLVDLPIGSMLATSSPRRSAQLRLRRPDLQIVEVRGNVGTRLMKLAKEPSWSGLILARAGLERLGIKIDQRHFDFRSNRFYATELQEMLPAAGQGAIGLEVATSNREIKELLKQVNDPVAWFCTNAERGFLRLLEGGCQIPMGIRSKLDGKILQLDAVVFDSSGNAKCGCVRGEFKTPTEAAVALLENIYGTKR